MCFPSCFVEKVQVLSFSRSSSWCHMWIPEPPSPVSGPNSPVVVMLCREHDSDIETFNYCVLRIGHQAPCKRRQQTQDLVVNLFKGYKACKDAEFVDYIKKKEDFFYEEGGQVTCQQLMDWSTQQVQDQKGVGAVVSENYRGGNHHCLDKPKSITSWSIRRNLPIQQASPMEVERRTTSRESTRKVRVGDWCIV